MSDAVDLIIVGAGMAEMNAAAPAVDAGVAIIERGRVCGTCPTRGCIPTKALIRSAEVAHEIRRAEEFGIRVGSVEIDFAAVMGRVRWIIDRGSRGAPVGEANNCARRLRSAPGARTPRSTRAGATRSLAPCL